MSFSKPVILVVYSLLGHFRGFSYLLLRFFSLDIKLSALCLFLHTFILQLSYTTIYFLLLPIGIAAMLQSLSVTHPNCGLGDRISLFVGYFMS